MTSKEVLNKEYADLCQKVGHLINNKEKIEQELAAIKERIKVLDSAGATLAQVEQALKEVEAKKAAQAAKAMAELNNAQAE